MLKLVKMKHTVTGTTLEIFYISEDIYLSACTSLESRQKRTKLNK